ncbi:MAG: nucleotidyltransferase family protein [Chitinophagaceae bacterium]
MNKRYLLYQFYKEATFKKQYICIMITPQQESLIKATVKKFSPSMVAVFGSYARNENTSQSDLDILIDFEHSINLIELIGLEQELSELLGIKVDLVTARSLSDKLKPYIQQDLVRIV